MNPAVDIQSMMVTRGTGSPARSGEVALRFVVFSLVQHREGSGVFRLPLAVQDAEGRTVLKTEAVGWEESRTSAAVAEVSLEPGDYWLFSPQSDCPPRGFRVIDRFSPPVQLCSHSRRHPSVLESRTAHDPRGQVVTLGQMGWIRACCAKTVSRRQKSNAFSLSVYVPLAGTLNLEVDGTTVRVRKGEYAIVNPNQISHVGSDQHWPIRFLRMTMHQPMLRAFRDAVGWSKGLGPFQFAGGVSLLKGGMRRVLEQWVDTFRRANAIGAEERLVLASQCVLHELVNGHPNALRERALDLAKPRRLDARMMAALAVLERSYGTDLTVKRVAREIGVGVSWLRHRFMLDLKVGFAEYLRSLRMKKAMEMLKDRTRTVREVAETVGYRDPRAFRRAFRKFAHTTPRNHLAAIRGG